MRKLLLLIFIFLYACTNQNEKSGGRENSDQVFDTTYRSTIDSTLDTNKWVAGNIMDWGAYLRANGGFSVDSFKLSELWVEDEMVSEPYVPSSEFFELYNPFLKYSQDSSYIVDLDSYNVHLKKEKDGKIVGYEEGPDCQIYLIDREKGIRERLLFFGPGTYVHEALWQDNETVILFGITEFNEFNAPNPVVWKINVEENLYEKYDYIHRINVDNWKDYSERVRFKDIRLK